MFLFYLTEHLRNGMGTGLELVALAGVVYTAYRHRWQDAVLLAFPLVLYVTLAKGENFARYAVLLLQQGTSILETVHLAGYFDQPHLTRALKLWVGQTPLQLLRENAKSA